jgi:RimJ/RimL family protein N-acetyltransferase
MVAASWPGGRAAATMVVNARSRRVMEQCGMRLVRVFHQAWPDTIEGDEHGDVEYALTRAEWERQQAIGPSQT